MLSMQTIWFLLLSSILSQSVCQPKKYDGAPCHADYWCKSGYCLRSRCVAALPGLKQECVDWRCAPGLGCKNKVCVPLPVEGQKCAMSVSGPYLCAEGFGCYAGRCKKIPTAINSSCTDFDFQCPKNSGCSFQKAGTNICVELRTEGQDCTFGECSDGLYCDFATLKCTKYLGIGGDCRKDTDSCQTQLDCHYYKVGWFRRRARCMKPGTEIGMGCTSKCGNNLYCGAQNKYS